MNGSYLPAPDSDIAVDVIISYSLPSVVEGSSVRPIGRDVAPAIVDGRQDGHFVDSGAGRSHFFFYRAAGLDVREQYHYGLLINYYNIMTYVLKTNKNFTFVKYV